MAQAQPKPEPPDNDYLFLEDKQKKEKKDKASVESENIRQKKKQFDALEKAGKLPFDVRAKEINFDQTGNKILADGGLVITYSSMVLEALKGVVDLNNNQAHVSGDVRMSDLSGTITADSANVDLKTGVGVLENADAYFSAGEFQLKGEEIGHEADDVYTLKNGTLTTCQCAEGRDCPPWRLRADSARIQRNGYGEAWGAKLDVLNIPVLYTPYLIFPAKTERQTGFLPFTFGNGRQSGFDLRAPFFWAIDRSTDMTITGIYESDVRYGADSEFRKAFSLNSKLQSGLVYFNESAREGRLLGTNTAGLSDTTFDENRFGGYWKQDWRGQAGEIPLQFIARGKYVSDDLFLREYENENIGQYNNRFVTSTAAFRVPLSAEFSADLNAEYNQSLVSDDDFVLQRLPELELTGIHVFRPFGENPYGLKLVAGTDFDAVNFVRSKSVDGSRSELVEDVKLPFNFRNYFEAQVEAVGRYSYYSLNETNVINEGAPDDVVDTLKADSDRFVPELDAKISTVVEKVFDVEQGNILRSIGELGDIGRNYQLSRVKHTIEPGLKYKLVPQVDQSDNPQFDSLDHLAQRNVVTYQLVQRLLGRYEPRNAYLYGIEEAAPEVEDLGNLRSASPIDAPLTFGFDSANTEDFQRLRSGSIREMATLELSQSYDFLSDEEGDSDQGSFSDIGTDLILYPNDYIYLRGRADFDQDTRSFSDYLTEGQVQDKRGDRVRARLRFVENQVRQLEGNLEVKLTDSIKLGYYGRYDDVEGEFIESKFGVRYVSACKCWIFDVNFSDRINPDETKVLFNITLVGLGELNQRFFPAFADKQRQQPSGS
jgi:LPS-assembly protein